MVKAEIRKCNVANFGNDFCYSVKIYRQKIYTGISRLCHDLDEALYFARAFTENISCSEEVA